MMPLKQSAAILMLATLSACITREIPVIADTSCTSFRALSYAVPSRQRAESAANMFDTPQTVEEIQNHNARWDILCQPNAIR
jgi:hypothetical protein